MVLKEPPILGGGFWEGVSSILVEQVKLNTQ